MSKTSQPQKDGLACRKCGGRGFMVVYTRHRQGYIVRSRKCKDCGHRMLTKVRPVGEE